MEPGAGGNHGAMTSHILAGQLTLSQPWGQIMPTTLQFALSLIFRPSYDPALARFANCFSPLKSHVEKKYMAYEFCSFALTSPQKVDLRRLVTFLHNHDSFYEPDHALDTNTVQNMKKCLYIPNVAQLLTKVQNHSWHCPEIVLKFFPRSLHEIFHEIVKS